MKKGILFCGLLSIACCNIEAVQYGYAFGLSENITVVAGETATIHAAIRNTGETPIVFPSNGAAISAQGISAPFGDWSSGDFFSQFQNVTIAPGDTFTFVRGYLTIDSDAQLGASHGHKVNALIDFTPEIIGNLLGVRRPGDWEYALDWRPTVTLTVGTEFLEGPMQFVDGFVVNKLTGDVLNGLDRYTAENTPETEALFALAFNVEEEVSASVPDAGSSFVLLALGMACIVRLRIAR